MVRSEIIAKLPQGRASEKLIEGCLVLEGGAFRGLYTQGYLDVMMENDLNLSCVIGVSAGALAGVNYVSGQIGRSARVNLGYRFDGRYIGVRAFLKSRSFLDVGFLTEDRGIIEPVDTERFFRPEQRYIAVATNCNTGRAEYFEKGKVDDIFLAARASATIPRFSPMVEIDGQPYLDGVVDVQIPYQWALDEGYEKIVVIRTRELSFRCEEPDNPPPSRMYRRYPAFAERLQYSGKYYNRVCEDLERLAAEGRVMHIAPSEPVRVGPIESNIEKLYELYLLGRKDCTEQLPALKAYLNVK